MAALFVCRHGQDEDNSAGVLNGHRDTPLTELGMSQAREVAAKLVREGRGFDAILSSPLQRARQTAETICAALGGSPAVEVEPDLVERDFGVLTGRPLSDIESLSTEVLHTEKVTYFLAVEGSESFDDCHARATRLVARLDAVYAGKRVLLVSHGDIGKMIAAARKRMNWRDALTQLPYIANTAFVEL